MRRNLKSPAFRFLINRDLGQRYNHNNHVIFEPSFPNKKTQNAPWFFLFYRRGMDVKHLMCFRSKNSVFKLLQRSVDGKHLMRLIKKKLFYFWYESWFDMVAGRSETIYWKATCHIWIAADSIWIARLRLRKFSLLRSRSGRSQGRVAWLRPERLRRRLTLSLHNQ